MVSCPHTHTRSITRFFSLNEHLQDSKLAWPDGYSVVAGSNLLAISHLICACAPITTEFSSKQSSAIPSIILVCLTDVSKALAWALPGAYEVGTAKLEVEQRRGVKRLLEELDIVRLVAVQVLQRALSGVEIAVQATGVYTEHQEPQLIASIPCPRQMKSQAHACFVIEGLHF